MLCFSLSYLSISGFVAVDFKEAMKKLKEFKGARLKVFQKMNDALRFAETPAESLVSPQSKDVRCLFASLPLRVN